jgi:hypothetical protein
MNQRFSVSPSPRLWPLIFLPFLTNGMPWDGAQHTTVQDAQGYLGSSPAPTDPPSVGGLDLRKRQSGGEICGFGNADISMLSNCTIILDVLVCKLTVLSRFGDPVPGWLSMRNQSVQLCRKLLYES